MLGNGTGCEQNASSLAGLQREDETLSQGMQTSWASGASGARPQTVEAIDGHIQAVCLRGSKNLKLFQIGSCSLLGLNNGVIMTSKSLRASKNIQCEVLYYRALRERKIIQ